MWCFSDFLWCWNFIRGLLVNQQSCRVMLFSAFELQITFAKTILLTTNSGTATTALIWPTPGTTALVGIQELIVEEFLSCHGFWGLKVNIYFVRGWPFRPMRNWITAESNHSRAFRGRTETKQKSFHLRDVQHELQLGHWRMVCIWKTSSLSSRFVLTSCLLYRCDMGVDSNGCWLGNYCQDINAGEVTFVFSWFIFWWDLVTGGCPVMTKRGSMEKLRALAARTDRSASGSGYSASGSGYSASGSGYTFGSGSD